jgi:hypothetical protein
MKTSTKQILKIMNVISRIIFVALCIRIVFGWQERILR